MSESPDLTISRKEAELAKCALQSVLSDLDALRDSTRSTREMALFSQMHCNVCVGITALRNANLGAIEAAKRNFE